MNTGVIIEVRPTDFVAGGESGAVKRSLEGAGEYGPWLPDEESQLRFLIDVFACVTFSALNDCETVFNYYLAKGLFPAGLVSWFKLKGYIDPTTSKFNFADRFTAKKSGTTKNGNSLGAVGDSIRHHGLVPEKVWPWPANMTESMTQDEKWDLYYAAVPQEAIDLGLEFVAKLKEYGFEIQYDWIVLQGITPNASKAIKDNLVYGPMQIAAAVCSPWSSNEGMPPISACGCGTGHATLIYGDRVQSAPWRDFDHYKSFRKLLAWDYCIPYAMQYTLREGVLPAPPAAFTYKFSYNLKFGDPKGGDVHKLQEALQFLGYMKAGVFGPYGPATRTAVKKFQVASGINDDDGSNFGPRSRAAMNKKLNG